jgi:hypothetical protein
MTMRVLGGCCHRAYLWVAALACFGALLVVTVSSASLAATTQPNRSLVRLVKDLFPKAEARLVPQRALKGLPAGVRLVVSLPDRTAVPHGTSAQKTETYDDVAWRLQLLAPLAAKISRRMVGYQLTYPHHDRGVPRSVAQDSLHGAIVRSGPFANNTKYPKIDSISYALARRQAVASIRTLSRALGQQLMGYKIGELSLERSRQFAISISITVRNAKALRGHLADVVDGLSTGLVGGSESLVEGLAAIVRVRRDPVVGAWSDIRSNDGSVLFSRSVNAHRVMKTTVSFRDLTGGPRTATELVLH